MALDEAIARFGRALKAKLGAAAVTGAPEDQLRAPLEALFADLSAVLGQPPGRVALVGEATLSDIRTRPDYAVTAAGALVGFIELKAPGKGADPRRFTDAHDRDQWNRLKALPNLIYSDGQSFALWQEGELVGEVVTLQGDIFTAGTALSAPDKLLDRLRDFLNWSPIPPASPQRLAQVAARLCRLLRDEVQGELGRANPRLALLAQNWRSLLFPEASDAEFADGYAQAVTFGLLMARAQGIGLAAGIDQAAMVLRRTNSMIGEALRLLVDSADVREALDTSLRAMARVFDAVDWPVLSRGNPEAWLYFYEDFLQIYDRALRRQTGSYYTPPEVVDAMIRLTDEALRAPELFARPQGLADRGVTICDPATGTGTFLLGVLRALAARIAADQGEGAVGPALAAATARMIGFELQFGPFAVAQLRLLAEMQALAGAGRGAGVVAGNNLPLPQLYVTDTLGDPFAAETQFSIMLEAIGESRRRANEVKRETPITVVIGNPPYKIDSAGKGGWVEQGSDGRAAPMALWTPPPEWGLGAHAKHLKNLYVFFWRWATWKVFAPDLEATTGRQAEDRGGIVCFITVAGFLNGPGFQKMREELRRDASAIWVIDCSPEGHQPEVATRLFQGVQQPVCIVLAARAAGKDRSTPAKVRFRSLAPGRREAKFEELAAIALHGPGWEDAPQDWRAPFLPQAGGAWLSFAPLATLFATSTPGVKTHRTWVIAPDPGSLVRRWDALRAERDPERKALLFHPDRDRTLDKVVRIPLGRHGVRPLPVGRDGGPAPEAVRYGFRSFDRQWIVADHRLLSQARADLWATQSPQQVHLTSPEDQPPAGGPAVTLAAVLPDQHHFAGRGGRAFPLWRDATATVPNLRPEVLAALSDVLGRPVPPEDLLAYIAALLAHPAFTARFRDDLRQPGLRVPLTADPDLWSEAVAIGSEVIWLHCYGERFADPAAGRPHGPPRLPPGEGPTIPREGAIPGAPEPLPDEMTYDPATRRLTIGRGFVANVAPEVWAYEVSGRNVLRQWFSYRRRDRSRPVIGERRPPSPLDAIQPDHWLPDYTEDLINLLHVLGRLVLLEPRQAHLLDCVCAGPLVTDLPSPGSTAATTAQSATDDRQGRLL